MAFNILNIPTGTLLLTNGGFVGLGNSLSIEDGEIKVTVDPSLILITIDNQLSTTSTNPVQNKVITNRLSFVESLVNGKADESNVYSKTQVDNLLDSYLTITDANQTYQAKGNYLTPSDITGKANVGDSYTKQESDAKYLTEHQDISGKANVGDSYTKAESDSKYLTEHQSLEDYLTIADAADTYAIIEDVREIDVVTAAALNDLELRKANSSDVSDEIDSKIAELGSTYYTKIESDSKFVGFDKLEADELVISSSLNDLNTRVESLENQEPSISRTEFNEFKLDSEDNELVVTTALTDLNDRIAELEQRIQALES